MLVHVQLIASLNPTFERQRNDAQMSSGLQVLAACDRNRSRGRRDYAILLLLSRLGLRGGEVLGLTLDDID